MPPSRYRGLISNTRLTPSVKQKGTSANIQVTGHPAPSFINSVSRNETKDGKADGEFIRQGTN
jgi:hypothetical protein